MIIAIDAAQLRAGSSEIRALSAQMEMIMSQVDAMRNLIPLEMRGASAQALEVKLWAMREQYQRLGEFMDAQADHLGVVAQDYEDFESDLITRINLA